MTEPHDFPQGPVQVQEPMRDNAIPFIDRHGIPPVLFVFLCLVGLFLLYQGLPAVITLIVFGFKVDGKIVTPENVNLWRLFTGLSQILLLLLPTLFLVRLVSLRPVEFFRLRLPKFQTFLLPLIGILSLQQMLQIYLNFQEKIPLPEPIERLSDQFKQVIEEVTRLLASSSTVPELVWVVLIIAVIPAFAEEFLFRGLVQRSLERSVSPWRGAVLSGVIFGLYHLNPASFVPLASLGIYLGFLAMRGNSLWLSVAAHFYNNAIACIAVFLHQNDDAIITGNPHEMSVGELLITFWLFGVVFLVSTYYFVHMTKPAEPVAIRLEDGPDDRDKSMPV